MMRAESGLKDRMAIVTGSSNGVREGRCLMVSVGNARVVICARKKEGLRNAGESNIH